MSMSWLATTPGNRFVMPCSSTAGAVDAAASAALLVATMTHAPWGRRWADDRLDQEHKRTP
jgi:hypothetical protein